MRVLLDRRVALHPSCKDVITTLARETLNSTISPGDHALAPRASILWQRAVPSRDGLSESLQDIPYVLVVLSVSPSALTASHLLRLTIRGWARPTYILWTFCAKRLYCSSKQSTSFASTASTCFDAHCGFMVVMHCAVWQRRKVAWGMMLVTSEDSTAVEGVDAWAWARDAGRAICS